MKGTEKIKMQINIAGEHLQLTVPFDRQDFVRDTEREITELYDDWRTRFHGKSTKEILAMMIYQYASRRKDLTREFSEATAKAEELEGLLDRLSRADAASGSASDSDSALSESDFF